MVGVTVWRFDTAEAAAVAARSLDGLVRDGVLEPSDTATVAWAEDSGAPRTSQPVGHDDGHGWAAFWGLFFGLVFYVPLIGAAVGTTTGTLSGALSDIGIDDSFINRVRDQVTPGTSALFLLASDSVVDAVGDALAAGGPSDLLFTTLTTEQEDALRRVFAG